MYEEAYRFNRELSVRDLVKEKWALAKASAVVRVYQPDVYANSGFWQTKLKSGFRLANEARATGAAAAVYIPDLAAYTDESSSVYAELHRGAGVLSFRL